MVNEVLIVEFLLFNIKCLMIHYGIYFQLGVPQLSGELNIL
jgi:hypothetical protein